MDQVVEIASTELVPSDVVILTQDFSQVDGLQLPCDMVLISGKCVLNESNLTGESVPVIKSPISQNSEHEYNPRSINCQKNTLYSGSRLLQVKGETKAIVMKTGYQTFKGNLIREILYPKVYTFQFMKDSFFFMGVMTFLTFVAFFFTIPKLIHFNYASTEIFFRTIDLITIAVPPSLPAVLSSCIIFSVRRLSQRGILCIHPKRISICGRIKTVVFDKTGTLTEESLKVNSHKASTVGEDQEDNEQQLLDAMSLCHSVTKINQHNSLAGDPLDIEMFKYVQSLQKIELSEVKQNATQKIVIHHDGNSQCEYSIPKVFDFESKKQRMSVVVHSVEKDEYSTIVKGSPEQIRSLCTDESIPFEFDEILQILTLQGFRVVAFAKKSLNHDQVRDITQLERKACEVDLHFLGLLWMENKLKPVSKEVIKELNINDVQTVMATGDNMLTAVSVAYQCNMIPPGVKVFYADMNKDDMVEWKMID